MLAGLKVWGTIPVSNQAGCVTRTLLLGKATMLPVHSPASSNSKICALLVLGWVIRYLIFCIIHCEIILCRIKFAIDLSKPRARCAAVKHVSSVHYKNCNPKVDKPRQALLQANHQVACQRPKSCDRHPRPHRSAMCVLLARHRRMSRPR